MTVDEIIKQLKAGKLDNPAELADMVVILSASLYQAGEFETDFEVEYMKKWAEIKELADYTDKLTDAKAKQTEEYRNFQRARNTTRAILETIRALKRKLKNLENELSSGQNY